MLRGEPDVVVSLPVPGNRVFDDLAAALDLFLSSVPRAKATSAKPVKQGFDPDRALAFFVAANQLEALTPKQVAALSCLEGIDSFPRSQKLAAALVRKWEGRLGRAKKIDRDLLRPS